MERKDDQEVEYRVVWKRDERLLYRLLSVAGVTGGESDFY
jgi:hypothetical protein